MQQDSNQKSKGSKETAENQKEHTEPNKFLSKSNQSLIKICWN